MCVVQINAIYPINLLRIFSQSSRVVLSPRCVCFSFPPYPLASIAQLQLTSGALLPVTGQVADSLFATALASTILTPVAVFRSRSAASSWSRAVPARPILRASSCTALPVSTLASFHYCPGSPVSVVTAILSITFTAAAASLAVLTVLAVISPALLIAAVLVVIPVGRSLWRIDPLSRLL